MAFERKDNTGAVFKNKKKEKDMHPDRTGDCTIGGAAYWISGWIKQDKNGEQYMSLSFKPKDQIDKPSSNPAPRTMPKARMADMDDEEIPF